MRLRRAERRASRATFAALIALAAGLSGCLVACSTAPAPSADDRRALLQLAPIAVRDAELAPDAQAGSVECWLPSQSKLAQAQGGDGFRVICRVHYEQAEIELYRDVICIGDQRAEPVADYCYRWAFYTDMPVFEDQPAYPVAAV